MSDALRHDVRHFMQCNKHQRIRVNEFRTILQLFDFNSQCYEVFRRWYIDGRMYYHIIIDKENPIAGIKELRYIDPRKLRKVREIRKKKDEKTSKGKDYDKDDLEEEDDEEDVGIARVAKRTYRRKS